MAIGNKKRMEVLKRDGFMCQYCGRTPPAAVMQVDHIIPASKGGSDEYTNLITSCRKCNMGKFTTPLTESEIPESEVNLNEMREKIKQMREYEKTRKKYDAQIKNLVWSVWETMFADFNQDVVQSNGDPAGFSTITNYIERIGGPQVLDAAGIAIRRVYIHNFQYWQKRFKYFCGVCRNKAKEIECPEEAEQEA